eukprot:2729201-Alexandrium_andersonii.AAC.1
MGVSITRSRPRFRELQPSPRGGGSRGVDACGSSFDLGSCSERRSGWLRPRMARIATPFSDCTPA